MLVPYTAGDVTSSSAVSCTVPSGESPSFSGEPDIVVGSALTDTSDNIENFLYTQNDICYTGTGTMSGKLLAGGNIYAESSTAKLTNYYTDIPTPWVGSGADTAPVVEQISRLGS
jgi:hypothetical protein